MQKVLDCSDALIMGILRHLIKVFILIGCVGFVYTIGLIARPETSPPVLDPYEVKVA